MDKTTFTDENGEELELFILEETEIKEIKYILAAEDEDGDSTAYILKETGTDDGQSTYEMVDDDVELDAVRKVFEELLEDTDFE